MSWPDPVHPHGPLRQVAPGPWEVTGSLPRSPLSRNMALWRVPGGLCVHSAVTLDADGMAALEALGRPGC